MVFTKLKNVSFLRSSHLLKIAPGGEISDEIKKSPILTIGDRDSNVLVSNVHDEEDPDLALALRMSMENGLTGILSKYYRRAICILIVLNNLLKGCEA